MTGASSDRGQTDGCPVLPEDGGRIQLSKRRSYIILQLRRGRSLKENFTNYAAPNQKPFNFDNRNFRPINEMETIYKIY
jgi:hypothetical protein